MRIKASNGKSTADQLKDILINTFPLATHTGIVRDLCSIKVDPKSKGKSVIFMWRKTTFKLTENLKVTEQDFTNTFSETDNSREVEAKIKSPLCSDIVVEAEKTPATEVTVQETVVA